MLEKDFYLENKQVILENNAINKISFRLFKKSD